METRCEPEFSFNITPGDENIQINPNGNKYKLSFSSDMGVSKIVIIFEKVSNQKSEENTTNSITFKNSSSIISQFKDFTSIQLSSAEKIKSCFRKWFKERNKHENKFVIKIQSCVRAWLSIKFVDSLKYKLRFKNCFSETLKLQSIIRMWLIKKNIQQYHVNCGWTYNTPTSKKDSKNKSKRFNNKQSEFENRNPYQKEMEQHPCFKTVRCLYQDKCKFLRDKGFCTFYHDGDENKFQCVPV